MNRCTYIDEKEDISLPAYISYCFLAPTDGQGGDVDGGGRRGDPR